MAEISRLAEAVTPSASQARPHHAKAISQPERARGGSARRNSWLCRCGWWRWLASCPRGCRRGLRCSDNVNTFRNWSPRHLTSSTAVVLVKRHYPSLPCTTTKKELSQQTTGPRCGSQGHYAGHPVLGSAGVGEGHFKAKTPCRQNSPTAAAPPQPSPPRPISQT